MCRSEKIRLTRGNLYECPDCGFHFYQNTAAATGLILETPRGILCLRRAKDPRKGTLTLPGGFVNAGEGVVEGARRECREETGWDPGDSIKFFASFPNVYPYKGEIYNTCDVYFYVKASDDIPLNIDKSESTGGGFIPRDKINLDEFAFNSTKNAVKTYLDNS
jgi:ADP-ribose pyrophosphatase YjhB (NUDIX family)